MKTRIFLVAMALVAFASLGFSQPAVVAIYDFGYALTEDCSGGPVLADGVPIEIRQDVNNNGNVDPDVDPLAQVGDLVGQWNFNTFALNGEAMGFPGGFYTDPSFSSTGGVPGDPRFYLVIRCSNGTPHFVSSVYVVQSGPQDWILDSQSQWACGECIAPPQCNNPQPQRVDIGAAGGGDPQNISVCIPLCAGAYTLIAICASDGHALNPALLPVVLFHPGCEFPCDQPCPPGDAIVTGPVYNPATGCFEYVVIGMADNTCFCFTFERFLSAQFNNDFVPLAMDASVKLTWSTASETAMNRFEIVRGTEVVGNVPATNGTSEHRYEFVDRSAVNGTTYSYTLRAVGVNNDVTDLATVDGVTPSFNAAVITEYALHQNFPNPFNPTTEIAFDVLNSNPVTLKIYNAAGQEVATLLNGVSREQGRYVVNFDSGNLTTGLYFYTVKIGSEFSATKKMLLVK
jgi:hypothetical protein